jgi:hypothetical protein
MHPEGHAPEAPITSRKSNWSPTVRPRSGVQLDACEPCDPHEADRRGDRLTFVLTILTLVRWDVSETGQEPVPAEDVRQVCEQVGLLLVPTEANAATLKLREIAPTLLRALRSPSAGEDRAVQQWRAAIECDDHQAARKWLAAWTAHRTD